VLYGAIYVFGRVFILASGGSGMRYIAFVALLVLLVACSAQGPVCTAPYMPNGQSCCLDKNNDSSCDQSSILGAVDCSLCPPHFVTQKEEVFVYRYVCMNQSVMDKPQDCGLKITSDAHLFTPSEEQDRAYVRGFSIRPACRGAFSAAELQLSLEQIPTKITIQIMDAPGAKYRDIGSVEGIGNVFYYIGFCDDCAKLTDAQVPANDAYLVRAQLTYPEKTIFTREYVMDATSEGDFGKRVC
jgi:hypothetical protein